MLELLGIRNNNFDNLWLMLVLTNIINLLPLLLIFLIKDHMSAVDKLDDKVKEDDINNVINTTTQTFQNRYSNLSDNLIKQNDVNELPINN